MSDTGEGSFNSHNEAKAFANSKSPEKQDEGIQLGPGAIIKPSHSIKNLVKTNSQKSIIHNISLQS